MICCQAFARRFKIRVGERGSVRPIFSDCPRTRPRFVAKKKALDRPRRSARSGRAGGIKSSRPRTEGHLWFWLRSCQNESRSKEIAPSAFAFAALGFEGESSKEPATRLRSAPKQQSIAPTTCDFSPAAIIPESGRKRQEDSVTLRFMRTNSTRSCPGSLYWPVDFVWLSLCFANSDLTISQAKSASATSDRSGRA